MEKIHEINLIPSDVLLKQQVRNRIWIWAGTIVALLLVAIVSYAMETRRIGTFEGEIANLAQQQAAMEQKARQMSILTEKRDQLATKRNVINALMNRPALHSLFSELEQVMHDRVWLSSLDVKDTRLSPGNGDGQKGEWVETGYFIVKSDRPEKEQDEQVKPRGIEVILQGSALSNRDLALLLQRLSESDYFSGVELKYSQGEAEAKTTTVEFEIEALLQEGRRI